MTEAIESKAGKFLTFTLDTEEYGLEILKVREIIGYMGITPVPRTPEFVKGVINLRGQVIPVVDLRLKFEMPEAEVTDQTCIIVVEVDGEERTMQMGIIVDSVSEVVAIKPEQLEESPEMGSGVDSHLILAMGKIGSKVKILLDINRVLCPDELKQLESKTESIGQDQD